MNSLEMRDKK